MTFHRRPFGRFEVSAVKCRQLFGARVGPEGFTHAPASRTTASGSSLLIISRFPAGVMVIGALSRPGRVSGCAGLGLGV